MKYLNKIVLVISFILISINGYSQYEFTYLYEFKKDSVSKKKYTDIMNVIIEGEQRIYRGENHIIYDSIAYTKRKVDASNISSVMEQTMGLKNNVENYTLEIDLEKEIQKHYIFNLELPFYNEEKIELPIWNISNETSEIDGKKVTKATTFFLGRNWTAYYSEELPIQVAPYLFYGLPGVIIKLEDENSNYKFELTSYKSKKDFINLKETTISQRRRNDFVKMNKDEVYNFGKSFQENKTNILMQAGLQLTEQEIKERQERNKKRKYIYLNPSIPFVL
ncbi:GLPGLI family protein [Empedobacter stercoris]|uniref:GLPGLI family protein n=1 Tax=Empedobacter stercoris TaxID=1628248 RepID=A0ABX1WMM2_9FLAO|nr:GLPGLI family protein [Empedobacter stercoris]NOJ75867.1 GLPGLI family protein [Empedobacter stercoris]